MQIIGSHFSLETWLRNEKSIPFYVTARKLATQVSHQSGINVSTYALWNYISTCLRQNWNLTRETKPPCRNKWMSKVIKPNYKVYLWKTRLILKGQFMQICFSLFFSKYFPPIRQVWRSSSGEVMERKELVFYDTIHKAQQNPRSIMVPWLPPREDTVYDPSYKELKCIHFVPLIFFILLQIML